MIASNPFSSVTAGLAIRARQGSAFYGYDNISGECLSK